MVGAQLFAGKVVLVTGAGSGIGRGSALRFAESGAAVVCVGRSGNALDETVALISQNGGRAASFVADVAESSEIASAVSYAVDRFGGLDIAHNNAGVFPKPSALADLAAGDWLRTLNTNVTGIMYAMQHEIRHMRAHGGGVIVNTSSNIGARGHRPGMAAYAASKAAVSTLSAIAALDHIADNVRINTVSPGATATEMSRRPGETDEDRSARLKNAVPIGRVGTVNEVVEAALWLASPASSFVVGTDLVIDGGATA